MRPECVQNIVQAGKYRIFADCYNSSLVAVRNTLKVVDELQVPAGNQKILVLGDVTALGNLAEETHRQIGQEVAAHQSDLFIGYGINMKYAVEEALKQAFMLFITKTARRWKLH